MAVEAALAAVPVAAVAGLALSVALERRLTPRPPLARPWAAWALHGGLWSVLHAGLTLALGRPWFSAAAALALLLVLVQVNNAKFRALREPFVFQDYEYFTDAIRHPRLYIPFLGWGKFLAATGGVGAAVAVGMWGEAVPADRYAWWGQLGGIALMLGMGMLLLWVGNRARLPLRYEPASDLIALGFVACLWRYAQEERRPPATASPFDAQPPAQPKDALPHLIAVQSESFFDARALYAGIRAEVLANYDRLKAEAVAHGKLEVPAWGANTVRTEFAFLTGIAEAGLGAHRFNPYRAIAAGWPVGSLAAYLKRLGYATVCVHPYPASFYRRDRVYPRLGFDAFVDIRAFDDTMRFGPYIGDAAVADKAATILREATGPVFVFVITMENHGPLHLERLAPGDVEAIYTDPPPSGCEELSLYSRHLRNADRMIAKLRETLDRCERPASLCWFGDHVPIMPAVYETLGVPDGKVEYLCWNSRKPGGARARALQVHELGMEWLRATGIGSR